MAKPWVPYVVQQGDHLKKLAFKYGVSADDLWGNAKNKDLAARRKTGDHLCPGDVLFVPAEPAPALPLFVGTRNKFKAKVPTTPIKMHLDSKRPIAGKKFEVFGATAGDEPIQGTVGGDGAIEFDAPVLAREVEIRIPDLGIRIPMHIGDLDPSDEPSGIAQRLRNLGYLPPAKGELPADVLAAAVRAFQKDAGIEETGVADEKTQKAIVDKHKS